MSDEAVATERQVRLIGGPYDGQEVVMPRGPVWVDYEGERYYKVGRDEQDRRKWVHSSVWGRYHGR